MKRREADRNDLGVPDIFKMQIDVERIFHALDDSTRRGMVEILSKRPRPVTHLANALCISTTAVGQHLRVLEDSGLVRTTKKGKTRICRLDLEGFAALENWAREQRTEWEKKLQRFSRVLE